MKTVSDHRAKAIGGVIWMSLSKCLTIAIAFILTPILFRGIGVEQYGIWSIVMALTGTYGLVNMGIGKANVKYIAEFDAVDDRRAVRQVVSTGMAMFSAMALVVVCIAGLVAWLFPVMFDIGVYPVELARWVVLLTAAKVVVELVGQVFRAGIMAKKRFDLRSITNTASRVIAAVTMIVVIQFGGGLVELATVVLVVGILNTSVATVMAIRIGLPLPSLASVNRDVGRKLFHFGALSLLIQIVRRFSIVGGSIVLGIFSGPAAVAFYSVAESLTSKSLNLGKPINYVVMPFASQFGAQSDRYALKRLVIMPTRLLLTIGAMLAAILFILGYSLLELWITPEAAINAYPIIAVLSLSVLIKMPTAGIQSVLQGMGKMTFLSRVAVAEGTVMLVLAVVLTPIWGAIGMAWAVVSAQLLTSGMLLPVYACQQLKLPMARLIVGSAGPAFLSVLPSVLLAGYFNRFVPVDSLLLLVLQIGAAACVAGIAAFFICLDAETRRSCWTFFLPRRKQKPEQLEPTANSQADR